MSIGSSIKLEGGTEALAALKGLDPKIRRATRKNIRTAARPLQDAARALVPSMPPLSGWTRGRYAFTGKAKSGVKTQIGGRGRARSSTWPLVRLKQTDAGGAVFDMAGRKSAGKTPQGRAFIRGLNARNGRASRSMWKAAEDQLPKIERNVEQAVEAAARQVNKELRRRY